MSVIKKINITDPTTHITTLNPIGALAGDVDYDNTNSGLQADDVQEALDEIAANMGEGTAEDTTYDNTESGLSADNVQDAIDEIDLTVNNLSASVLSINNDIDEIELNINDLSSSIVTINSNINDINDNINEIDLTIDQLSSSVLSIKDDVQELELTVDNLSASTLGYDNTDSGLVADNVQGAIDEISDRVNELVTVEANPSETPTATMESLEVDGTIYKVGGGHAVKDSSGNTMTQRENLQFTDAHTSDDSQGNTTKVEIAKQVTSAEWENAAEQGFYLIGDDDDYLLDISQVANADAEHLPYSSTQSTKQKIDEMLKYKSVVVTTDSTGVILFNQLGLPTGVTMNDIYSITVVDGVSYAWAIINNPTYIKIVAITNTSTSDDRIKHISSTQLRLNIAYKQ